MNEKIDFVITWVDGDDPVWLAEKEKYVTAKQSGKQDVAGKARYEDTGLLQYWFRGVEKFAPWVNKIYFVTYGHLPSWLNTESEKLVIVNHEDFLPVEYRPTFNSVTLNLNLHRIKGLSENFVYFNDDMFLIKPAEPELFFKNGLPRDMAVQDIIPAISISAYYHMVFNDITLLNQHYSKRESQKKYRKKWFNTCYGKQTVKNLLLSRFPFFSGIYETHLPAGYLKSQYEKAWEQNGELFNEISCHKFRDFSDVSENYIRYSQLAEGRFEPINKLKFGRYCTMESGATAKFITEQNYNYLCINDMGTAEQVERIRAAFETILPEKSVFEK